MVASLVQHVLALVYSAGFWHWPYAAYYYETRVAYPAIAKLNAIFKYADDTTLLAPEHADIDISEEFQHIKIWSAANKLTLNLRYNKTTEIVFFKRLRALHFHMPPAVDGINQLDSVKLLGVMFQS